MKMSHGSRCHVHVRGKRFFFSAAIVVVLKFQVVKKKWAILVCDINAKEMSLPPWFLEWILDKLKSENGIITKHVIRLLPYMLQFALPYAFPRILCQCWMLIIITGNRFPFGSGSDWASESPWSPEIIACNGIFDFPFHVDAVANASRAHISLVIRSNPIPFRVLFVLAVIAFHRH